VKNLNGRVAVVTGGAAGIGRGIVQVLADEGASVVVADIDEDAAAQTVEALKAQGREALAANVDVADRGQVESMVSATIERYGRIDILAANAGVYRWDPLTEITDEVWQRIMDINLKGAFNCVQACVPVMRRQAYGRVVLTSSITGPVVAAPGLAHYAASKEGMLGLMRGAAFELVSDGITVNAVQPGNVRTPGTGTMDPELAARVLASVPLGRLAEPEEIGWAVRFFASEEAAYVTGQSLIVDGGQVLPEVRA
jgi:3-oxoacyl-[acyl-carrier protein] reductase